MVTRRSLGLPYGSSSSFSQSTGNLYNNSTSANQPPQRLTTPSTSAQVRAASRGGSGAQYSTASQQQQQQQQQPMISPTRTSSRHMPYRNSSDNVAAILGGGGSPLAQRPGSRPLTQGRTRLSSQHGERTQGLMGVGVGSSSSSSPSSSLHSSSTPGTAGAGSGGGGGGGGAASRMPSVVTTQYDCKVLTSSGKTANREIKLTVGDAELQGFRPTMEDAHFACIDATQVDGTSVSLFAVLDGHCGRRVADLGAKILPDAIFSHPQLGQNNATALVEGILQTDKMVFQKMGRTDGGATCIAALIYGRMLFVACVGDARAVVYDGANAVPMSVDHKPADACEQQRIVRCGGIVQFGRVNGCLAVSRALGDFEFKVTGPKFVQREFMVSNVADIRQINITDATKFVILACDGLWDVLTNEQACEFVSVFLSNADLSNAASNMRKTLNLCAMQLANFAIEKGSMDNVSVQIIILHADAIQANFGGGKNGNTGSVSSGGVTPSNSSSSPVGSPSALRTGITGSALWGLSSSSSSSLSSSSQQQQQQQRSHMMPPISPYAGVKRR